MCDCALGVGWVWWVNNKAVGFPITSFKWFRRDSNVILMRDVGAALSARRNYDCAYQGGGGGGCYRDVHYWGTMKCIPHCM